MIALSKNQIQRREPSGRRSRKSLVAVLVTLASCLPLASSLPGVEESASPEAAVQLEDLQDIVGSWSGTGQVQRRSAEGSWREKGQWSWQFEQGKRQLVFQSADGRFMRHAVLTVVDDARLPIRLRLEDSDTEVVSHFAGKASGPERIELIRTEADVEPDSPSSDKSPGMSRHDRVDRITIRLVARGDRLLTLFEERRGQRWSRLGEVGATRLGSQFANAPGFIECVVTGGKGTIPVTYEGQTWYVCCGGCRDYFLENPEKVLQEYQQRKAEEKAKREAEAN